MLALCDCNNFFASCERVVNPSLEGKPVVVLSNNDGVIVSRSAEAKSLGIKMGEPFFKVKAFCKSQGVKVLSGNMELYSSVSAQVMDVVEEFAPGSEIYSIDEAFMDWGMFIGRANLEDQALKLKRLIKDRTGMPVSIGIAPTKVLTKLANDYAKKHTSSGIYDLSDTARQTEVLKLLEVGDIWGIGRRSAQKLINRRIKAAWDYREAPKQVIRKLLGINGERLQLELQGMRCFRLNEHAEPAKSIQSTRSFGTPIFELNDLREPISAFTARAAEKLRIEGEVAKRIGVYIRTSRHNAQQPYYYNYKETLLPIATDDTPALTQIALSLLEDIFQKGHAYKKAGVLLADLTPTKLVNRELFENEISTTKPKKTKLMTVYDDLVARWGREKIFFASSGTSRSWKSKKEHLSVPIMATQADKRKSPRMKFIHGA